MQDGLVANPQAPRGSLARRSEREGAEAADGQQAADGLLRNRQGAAVREVRVLGLFENLGTDDQDVEDDVADFRGAAAVRLALGRVVALRIGRSSVDLRTGDGRSIDNQRLVGVGARALVDASGALGERLIDGGDGFEDRVAIDGRGDEAVDEVGVADEDGQLGSAALAECGVIEAGDADVLDGGVVDPNLVRGTATKLTSVGADEREEAALQVAILTGVEEGGGGASVGGVGRHD